MRDSLLKRWVNALLNRGFIDGYDKNYSYVEYPMNRLSTQTKYNNNSYVIKYFDGCFMPFVCKVINNKMEGK